MGESKSFGGNIEDLKVEDKNEEELSKEKDWENKVDKMKKLIENKKFMLASNEKTKEMAGKVWFEQPLKGKMDGMFFVNTDGTVFGLDFRKEDFIGALPGMEKLFLDKMQTLMEKVGFKLCVINSDLQKASDIEDDIRKQN